MGSPVLGIDLGTTNSVVAVAAGGAIQVLPDAEGNKLFPSVVSFHPSGSVLAGYPARERRLVDAANTVYSIKRLIGRPYRSEEVRRARERFPFSFQEGPTGGPLVVARGETYTLPEISAFVLRGVRAQAEEALGEACRRAVVTVPANFNELQRSATKAAGRVAGLEILRILNEPTAAALAYGCGAGKTRERVAVYDLGGGTFDITILDLAGDVFEVVATAGDTFLGGDDIDILVADEMTASLLAQHRYDARGDVQAYERLRAAAEWAKCQLSSTEDVELTVEEIGYATGGASIDLRYQLSRAKLESMTQALIARTFDVCEEAMRSSGLRPTQIDQVILVGGSTRMPSVRAMVAQYFGREPLGTIDPDLVVAQGAAIQGAALAAQPEAASTSAPTAIGKVALRKMPRASLAAAANEQVASGPAFQPKRSPTLLGMAALDAVKSAGQKGSAKKGSLPQPSAFSSTMEVEPLDLLPLPTLDADSLEVLDHLQSLEPPSAAGGRRPGPANDDRTVEMDEQPDLETIALPNAQAPLLLDVTPQTLRIETVAGFTEIIIERNAAIPVEQSRIFITSQDFQETVKARVCQGESRKLVENQELGMVELVGLKPTPRGKTRIEVTFVMDADGTLQVKARDIATGVEQSIRIDLVGAVRPEDIARMQQRQQALVG
ncbi:MAG: Chaperone protein DnaK [Myxococcaceae bacterium]|nr:Chaperone protein DnaK [Myxococcaceae bacterium]